MKKLGATVLVLSVFGIVAACSQGDDHPPFLGDCDGCGNPVPPGSDAATEAASDVMTKETSTADVTVPDVTVQDAKNDTVQDAQDEGDATDLDTGADQ